MGGGGLAVPLLAACCLAAAGANVNVVDPRLILQTINGAAKGTVDAVSSGISGAVSVVEPWLKPETSTSSSTTTLTSVTTTTSSSTATTTDPVVVEVGVFLPGNDLRAVIETSAADCLLRCKHERQCVAFSWEKVPGTLGKVAACHLKGVHPRPVLTKVRDEAYTSGYIHKAEAALSVAAQPPQSSLYCFAVVRMDSYELGLLKVQYSLGMGIFRCDEYAVLSNVTTEVVPGLVPRIMNSSLYCEEGGKWHTALNNGIFMSAWERVLKDGRFLFHDWTLKADPDSVFFPSRLRPIVARQWGAENGVYVRNCKFGLHGPIEVISRKAVEVFGRGKDFCLKIFADELWGEDKFLERCFEALNITQAFEPDSVLVEDHCEPPMNWQDCRNGKVAALHPFKSPAVWTSCAMAARAAEDYRWSLHIGYSLEGFQTVQSMSAHDIAAVKLRVETRGYAGFVLQGDQAMLKASLPHARGWLVPGMDDEVVYMLGHNLTVSPLAASGHSAALPPPPPAGSGLSCFVDAEPVFSYWNEDYKDHTLHFEPAWHGESNQTVVAFFAFRHQVPGSEPVYDFWHNSRLDHTFHMGAPSDGEEIGRIQFYAYPNEGGDRVGVSSFWQVADTETTSHTGGPWAGETELATVFYTPPGGAREPAVASETCNPCFTSDVAYEPPMAGQVTTTEPSASTCQKRCATTEGCMYFSFDVKRYWCGLADYTATPRPNLVGMIGGPPRCKEEVAEEVPFARKDQEEEQEFRPQGLLAAAPAWQTGLAAGLLLLAALGGVAYALASARRSRLRHFAPLPSRSCRAVPKPPTAAFRGASASSVNAFEQDEEAAAIASASDCC